MDTINRIGDLYYSDVVGWHMVIIEYELDKNHNYAWWKAFIIEEQIYNWYTEPDLASGTMWTKLA